MSTDERLLQMLENSACLSKGQLLGYIKHTLYPEELRAVELHLSSCAFCNDALEGFGLQADPDKLLASLVPPPLPAMAPREKPREKKENHPVKEEKKIPAVKNNAGSKPDMGDSGQAPTRMMMPRRRGMARPLGIAAALLIAAGAAFWYLTRDDSSVSQDGKLAGITKPLPDTDAVAENRAIAATEAKKADEAALKETEKRHNDSLLVAKRTEARLKAARDSSAIAANMVAAKTPPAGEPQALAAQPKAESTAVADEIAAAPAMAARNKEESKPADEEKAKKKTALSDYELGMQQYKQKNYASALLYFKTAESDKGDSRHWDAVYYSGLCNRNLKKDRKARKLFERVIEANAPQKKSAQKQLDDMEKKKDNK